MAGAQGLCLQLVLLLLLLCLMRCLLLCIISMTMIDSGSIGTHGLPGCLFGAISTV